MIFLALSTVLIALCVVVAIRDNLLAKHRIRIIHQISNLNQKEINDGIFDRWRNRYAQFDQTNEEKMLWQFWKPFRSFYPEGFLEEIEGKPKVTKTTVEDILKNGHPR